ncbi:hypothetical protein [Streptomyces sp. NPDC058092]|uniref:hypothetical protein n=1 Tax=Streptomyces sp. NPDC058092 TaxID=3346336 RepID=UPI0036E586F5
MNAFQSWYEELSSLSRDIVLQYCCDDAPVSLEQLAQRHALARQAISQGGSTIAYSFNRHFEDISIFGGEIAQVELDLRKPCAISWLLRRHPWFGESVGDGLTVMNLFTGMRWKNATADSTGQWIYGADLCECVDSTVRALDLGTDEVISLSTALRLLYTHEVPVPEDLECLHAWLDYCGLERDGDQIALPAPACEEPSASALEVHVDLQRLIRRLTELLQVNENPIAHVTLGEIIRSAGELDGELRDVACLLRDAMFVGGGIWITPDGGGIHAASGTMEAESAGRADCGESGATKSTTESDGAGLSDPHASDPNERADSDTPTEVSIHSEVGAYASPADRIARLLEDKPEGLRSSLIESALGKAVSQKQVIKALFGDDRFAITHQGAWYLQSAFGATSSSDGGAEPFLFAIDGDVPSAVPSTKGGADSSQAAVDGARACGGSQREYERLDKIESALREADQPLSIEELKERTGITLGSHYLRQQIEGDPRFSRSQKNQWALAVWGMPVYKAIKELISDVVDAHGGAVAADEVVRVLCRDFEIKESSLRQAMSSAPFTARGGRVRRLGEDSAESEAAIPASWTSHSEESGQPDGKAPDVDDLMGRMGLI